MKVKFYGVRGSIPVCDKDFVRYGGNTTCICIERVKETGMIIIDAGTGIRSLGKQLIAREVKEDIINIVFTHFHWDHIQGFPFFAPAYNKNQKIRIHVMGSERKFKNLKEIFSAQMQEEYFPVQLDAMGAQFEFLKWGDKETFSNTNIIAVPQYHKTLGGSYGLRIEQSSHAIVVCTDIEHPDKIDENIVTLAMNADILIHDGQYTDEEYKKYKGWGHSTWRHAVEVAIRAKVKKLIITHHDPDHNDDFLDSMEKECKKEFTNSLFAREGVEYFI